MTVNDTCEEAEILSLKSDIFHQEHLQRTIPSRYLGNTEAAALGASATLLPGHYVDVAFDAGDTWVALLWQVQNKGIFGHFVDW